MIINSKTDIGLVRSSNQDAFFAAELEGGAAFAVVCDGMGGANAGNIASETAVRLISEYVVHSFRLGMDSFEAEKLLKNAITSANIEIYGMAQKDPELNGMGTTAVTALVEGDRAVIVHVGDSRAYIAGKELAQLTRDHSVVQSLLESGKITPEDAKSHPRKNVITRALGAEQEVISDGTEVTLKEGESLLLCTDGLSGFAEPSEILGAINIEDKAAAVEELVRIAKSNGGGDNITVVLLGLSERKG